MSDPDLGDEPVATGAEDLDSLTRKFQKELNAGLVGLVLLALLDRAQEDLYGYQIAKQLQQDDGSGAVKQGALYPVLRTMAANGLLASRIVPSYSGPPRRYYRITDQGRAVLRRWLDIWNDMRTLVDSFAPPDSRNGAVQP